MYHPMQNIQRDVGSQLNCGQGGGANTYFKLRVASIFIIFAGSTTGALFPVLARRVTRFRVPIYLFEYVSMGLILRPG
jgi:zinc transporter 1/2/3